MRETKREKNAARFKRMLSATGLKLKTIRKLAVTMEAGDFVQVGLPQFVDLVTMKRTLPDDLRHSELAASLTRLTYCGSGVIFYYVDPDQVKIGANTELRDYCVLEVGGTLNIGENCVIGAYNWLQSSGSITIGNGVIIGPHTAIISTTHQPPAPDTQVRLSPLQKGDVQIGDNTWIGAHVSILKGVRIGRNVTIGAGSVVTSDIPDNATAVGTPCKVVKTL